MSAACFSSTKSTIRRANVLLSRKYLQVNYGCVCLTTANDESSHQSFVGRISFAALQRECSTIRIESQAIDAIRSNHKHGVSSQLLSR